MNFSSLKRCHQMFDLAPTYVKPSVSSWHTALAVSSTDASSETRPFTENKGTLYPSLQILAVTVTAPFSGLWTRTW